MAVQLSSGLVAIFAFGIDMFGTSAISLEMYPEFVVSQLPRSINELPHFEETSRMSV